MLLSIGVLLSLFVGYQLWGTGIPEARAQARLRTEFDELALAAGASPPSSGQPLETSTSLVTGLPPPPPVGASVARIEIPAVEIDKIVVEGVEKAELSQGPGHYPHTPQPGQSGNVAIAGHRTTYGAPFNRIDELLPGDEIYVTTPNGQRFRYVVVDIDGDGNGHQTVTPTQVDVLEDKGDDRLTLTSCHPEGSARERIVVVSQLVPTIGSVRPTRTDATPPPPPARGVPRLPTQGTADQGWLTVVTYSLGCAAVWFVAWLAARRWRGWVCYSAGLPLFAMLLLGAFEAVSTRLPPGF